MTIYERIKYLRESLNMSQQELAEKVGHQSKSAVSKVERGERDIKQNMIVKYANALGVTPVYLLFGEDDQSPSTYVDAVMKKMPPEELQLSEGDKELLDLIRLMPPEMKAMYREALRAALKSQGLI